MLKKKNKIIIAGLAFLAAAGWLVWRGWMGGAGLAAIDLPANYLEPLVVRAADFTLSIRPVGATPSPYQGEGWGGVFDFAKSAKKVRYADAYEQADAVETVGASGIKEEIILKGEGHPASFEYIINSADFEVKKDEQGNLNFYRQATTGELSELDRLFTIPAPFMIDARGERSAVGEVEMTLQGDRLKITPSAAWLAAHQYPIVLDPSVELAVLNLYSHPLAGENWEVSFTTRGTADLTITPNDRATVEDDEFVGLWCDGDLKFSTPYQGGVPDSSSEALAKEEERGGPELRAGDVIFYPDWSCAGAGKVVHKTLKAGDHTLRFQFGDEIAYAYNHFTGDRKYGWGENIGWLNASSTHETLTVAPAGLTGYLWGENIGWIKLDYDGVAGATNTTATDWGVTNDGFGNLGGYGWGENIGWLNFHPTHSQVKIDMLSTADFSGLAWGENIGWINFGHTMLNYVPRFVTGPLAVTAPASNIGSLVVTANGRAYVAGSPATVRGFKYGLTETDTWTVSESGNFWGGDYKLVIPDLAAGTTYYIRAYATNSEGTSYGAYVSFTTETEHKGSPVIFKENVIMKENIIVR